MPFSYIYSGLNILLGNKGKRSGFPDFKMQTISKKQNFIKAFTNPLTTAAFSFSGKLSRFRKNQEEFCSFWTPKSKRFYPKSLKITQFCMKSLKNMNANS
jgi:hypothetical protein